MNSNKVQEQQLTVKVNHGEEIRRFSIPFNTCWKSLVQKISAVCSLDNDSFIVKYIDGDKDLVTIDSDAELEEAIRVFTQISSESGILCLRFTVLASPLKLSQPCVREVKEEKEEKIPELLQLEENGSKRCHGRRRCCERRGQKEEMKRMNWEELKPKLLELQEKGFKCKRRNIRLLCEFDGNVDKVIEFLEKKQEKCNQFREAAKKLEENGFNKKGLNFSLLKRFDGDTEKVIKLLNQCKILEEMGFDRNFMNVRLLLKFDGDINKVTEVWEKKTEKMMKKSESKLEKIVKKEEKKQNKKCGMRGKRNSKEWKRRSRRNSDEWKEMKHQRRCSKDILNGKK